MDTQLTETQSLLRDAMRDYLQKEVSFDRIRELERSGGYDRDLWAYLQQSGYLGLPFPASFGGDDGELTDLAVLLEELTRRAVVIPLMETMACALAVQRNGDAAIAREIIAGITGGTMTLAPALLEGSEDPGDVQVAVSGGKISGVKKYVDYGQHVSHHLVAAREGGALGLYLVDANSPAVTAQPHRTMARTPQATIRYDGAEARKAGGEDAVTALRRLGRAFASVQCLGNAQQALDMAVEYTSMRVQFGRPIGTFQAIGHMIADMATEVEAARALTAQAAAKVAAGRDALREISMAKLFASETFAKAANTGMQVLGAYGYSMEFDMQRWFRDSRAATIAAGTSQMQRNLIANLLGLKIR